ncbi:hypothetical protein GFL82_00005, partial [Rhizobium laguerreae]|nr:hypothetical protein [Rhizobium laguerreae]
MIVPATQLAYAAGLFALVPLGDMVDRRRLIVGQFVILAMALTLMAFAHGTAMVIAASVAVGFTATVAQQIIPFAALTCHCEFPPGWIRVRPIKGRTNEEAEI